MIKDISNYTHLRKILNDTTGFGNNLPSWRNHDVTITNLVATITILKMNKRKRWGEMQEGNVGIEE